VKYIEMYPDEFRWVLLDMMVSLLVQYEESHQVNPQLLKEETPAWI
jgi:hypothetical protein